MKKIIFKILLILVLLIKTKSVIAKDTIYSINKYSNENLFLIEESYDKNHLIDGLITGGTFQKELIKIEDSSYENDQVIIIKYKKNGKVAWKYIYGESKKDVLLDMKYSYDENIDGYLILVEKTYDILDPTSYITSRVFLKLDLDGNLVLEKETLHPINKILPVTNELQEVTSYIGITKNSIIYYDKELNEINSRVFSEDTTIEDIIPLYENNQITGFALKRSNENETYLDKLDIIENSIYNLLTEKNKTISLHPSNNGFILYSLTDEVKLKKGDNSFLIQKYDGKGTKNWELFGETPVNKEKKLILSTIQKDNSYLLLYQNGIDKSYEVIIIKEDGFTTKKIKKIKNDYYTFENFICIDNTLYFIGQINCPEDDNCDYDGNSLFLISDEDKVIEVKDNDSEKIIFVIGTIFVLIGTSFLIKRKLS